jgi:hypothetical protein
MSLSPDTRAARKKIGAGMKAKRSTPCPMTGSGRKEKHNDATQVQCDPKWITVRYPARCAEPNCQTPISAGDRAFYYPSDRALYGSGCGHGEKAERDFAAHRIDEDGY